MAFPDFRSSLHDERMRQIQNRERNFFENVGLESTWIIELLPDQPFDLAKITDVRVWFQYEALFDENLKRVLLPKRYAGRPRDGARIPIGRLAARTRRRRGFLERRHLQDDHSACSMRRRSTRRSSMPASSSASRMRSRLNGEAELEVAYEGATPAALTTNTDGIVATAPDHPHGTGLDKLAAIAHGKSVEGTWTIRLDDLPSGVAMERCRRACSCC